MKKLLVLLLITTLTLFVLTGCEGVVPAEGEGEGETEEVTVEIEGAVELGGKTWIACGNHEITITFPAPVENASAYVTHCSGYYGTEIPKSPIPSGDVVLFPNADKTVWTGSGYFGCYENNSVFKANGCSPCCASYVEVTAGECDPEACIVFPVIVDCDLPFAEIEVSIDGCLCEGCEITFESTSQSQECAEADECCGDYCSGLASWAITLFDEDPFDICCETPCAEPIYTCSGTECPISCTTDCLSDGTYYAVVNLVDNVGNEVEYYATLEVTSEVVGSETECELLVTEYCADVQDCECTSFDANAVVDTGPYIGFCWPSSNCCNGGID